MTFITVSVARRTVRPPRRRMELDVTPDAFYAAPEAHYRRLYERWVREG